MKTKVFINEKAREEWFDWENGPWFKEPDKIQWLDAETGLPCLIVRNHCGALCGYVGVSKDHPFFEKHYNDCDMAVNIHGGLTFADHCKPSSENPNLGICHLVEEGEDDNVWWLGFDTAHGDDIIPSFTSKTLKDIGITGFTGKWGETYKDVPYVTKEVESLARQLKEVQCTQQMK